MKETFSGLESGVIGTIDMDQPVRHDQFYPHFVDSLKVAILRPCASIIVP